MQTTDRFPPLWQRFPAVFAYGLQPVPLGLALTLALADGLLGGFSWLVGLVTLMVLLKYGFAALLHTAEGELSPPKLERGVILDSYELPLLLFALILVVLLLGYEVGRKLGAGPALAIWGFALLALPASIMTLAYTQSLWSALNPVLLLNLILRIGWPYAALYGLLFLLALGQTNLMGLVSEGLSAGLLRPAFTAINAYFTIVSFHIMGYMLLQRHERVGTSPNAVGQGDTLAVNERLADFHRFVDGGKIDAAIAELEYLLQETPGDMELHRLMHGLLILHGRGRKLAQHARSYLPLLLRAGEEGKASELYFDCRRLGGEIRPADPKHRLGLAQALRHGGQSQAAVAVLKGFHQEHPDSEEIPRLYLLMARILCEDLGRDELALKTIAYLEQSYPEHPLRPEIDGYRETLRMLAQA